MSVCVCVCVCECVSVHLRATMAPGFAATSRAVRLSACVLCALLCAGVRAGLYTDADQILILSPDQVDTELFHSSSATLVEFYASWCGHCVAFSPVWKSLALDIKEWKPAVNLAAIDCADDENFKVCKRFGIRGFPSIKIFPAFSTNDSAAQNIRNFRRDVPGLRHLIIDKLESFKEAWPPAFPPLEATSATELDAYLQNYSGQHVALVFEKKDSYMGREVILDLLQFENVAVRRVLESEEELVSRLGVADFPSCYLYYSPTNFSRLSVLNETRAFYSSALQKLPGVVRAGKPKPAVTDLIRNETEEQWRSFNRTRVYMSDLESALHYSLRVEVAAHTTVSGDDLTALRGFVSVLTKYFPGRPPVKCALKAAFDWLQEQKGASISYSDFRAALDVKSPNASLPGGVRWVGCQGSKPHTRGYSCAMWTLFHVLTVQAERTGAEDPQEVLQAMRRYVQSFFGCHECAHHFESMAEEDLDDVTTLGGSVLWLWSRHNCVNNRLAGALNEDPHFPKLQWPPPDLCPACHGVDRSGEHVWVQKEVLSFLKHYYSSQRLLHDFLPEETASVVKDRRKARGAQEEEEKTPPKMLRRKPSMTEDIVDLDSSIGHFYKAWSGRRRQDGEDDQLLGARRAKRDLGAQEVEGEAGLAMNVEAASPRSRWMLVLSVGFSRLDVSLCVMFYLLSTFCVLAMCLYFRVKRRLRWAKVALP
ncbi:sulfhydryl oxidase 1 [Trichomycterus rosablanca]|uniref:sulfhydryl oxidase 1 n=1 Tax=Trichomycterus rosablanca TaxID=2290929 RepID=UPI002F358109